MHRQGPFWLWFFSAAMATAMAMAMATVMESAELKSDVSGSCLSWRVAVETGNLLAWATVPDHCVTYVELYMIGQQYRRDRRTVADAINKYVNSIVPHRDGMDAWVLDVDDTCLSNIQYYTRKRFGGDPFDRTKFDAWAWTGRAAAIPEIQWLFRKLVGRGFKVFLISGRDEDPLMQPTLENLWLQGFVGFHRLIMRGPEHKGMSAVAFKSEVRKRLAEEGYRIRGNVGDQWSDLTGDHVGDRIFKVPNPMYFVP